MTAIRVPYWKKITIGPFTETSYGRGHFIQYDEEREKWVFWTWTAPTDFSDPDRALDTLKFSQRANYRLVPFYMGKERGELLFRLDRRVAEVFAEIEETKGKGMNPEWVNSAFYAKDVLDHQAHDLAQFRAEYNPDKGPLANIFYTVPFKHLLESVRTGRHWRCFANQQARPTATREVRVNAWDALRHGALINAAREAEQKRKEEEKKEKNAKNPTSGSAFEKSPFGGDITNFFSKARGSANSPIELD